eukprot:7288369-Alexandrium_andersonii.AAC.1
MRRPVHFPSVGSHCGLSLAPAPLVPAGAHPGTSPHDAAQGRRRGGRSAGAHGRQSERRRRPGNIGNHYCVGLFLTCHLDVARWLWHTPPPGPSNRRQVMPLQ